eukprot:GILI01003581.1.p1 GENE.GILI01003581.1~~GILI01003581.1.p1  ORF type:complete len:751 (-),score=186.58 GILI01003581.1:46-2172(-)
MTPQEEHFNEFWVPNPKYATQSQKKRELRETARVTAGLEPEFIDVKNPKIPSLTYVPSPTYKSRKEMKEDRRRKDLEEGSKRADLQDTYMDGQKRLEMRENQALLWRMSQPEGRTWKQIQEERKQNSLEYNRTNFSKQTLGVHGKDLPPFASLDQQWWTLQNGYNESPTTTSAKRLNMSKKYWAGKDPYTVNSVEDSPAPPDPFKEVHVREEKIGARLLDKITNMAAASGWSPATAGSGSSGPDDFPPLHAKRWTTQVLEYKLMSKGGRLFDSLPKAQASKEDWAPLYSSFTSTGHFPAQFSRPFPHQMEEEAEERMKEQQMKQEEEAFFELLMSTHPPEVQAVLSPTNSVRSRSAVPSFRPSNSLNHSNNSRLLSPSPSPSQRYHTSSPSPTPSHQREGGAKSALHLSLPSSTTPRPSSAPGLSPRGTLSPTMSARSGSPRRYTPRRPQTVVFKESEGKPPSLLTVFSRTPELTFIPDASPYTTPLSSSFAHSHSSHTPNMSHHLASPTLEEGNGQEVQLGSTNPNAGTSKSYVSVAAISSPAILVKPSEEGMYEKEFKEEGDRNGNGNGNSNSNNHPQYNPQDFSGTSASVLTSASIRPSSSTSSAPLSSSSLPPSAYPDDDANGSQNGNFNASSSLAYPISIDGIRSATPSRSMNLRRPHSQATAVMSPSFRVSSPSASIATSVKSGGIRSGGFQRIESPAPKSP